MAANEIKKNCEEPFHYIVPATYSKSHDDYLDRMDFYKKTMEELIDAVNKRDVHSLNEVLSKLQ